MTRPIVLASASPRRRALLAEAGLTFEVLASGADEEIAPERLRAMAPEEVAVELAVRKAEAVAATCAATARESDLFVIGADTIVALPESHAWRMLGKPSNPSEASQMLRSLSASRHAVVTGVCVIRLEPESAEKRALAASETTWVTMRVIEPHEIAAYVASEEWRDKAGGYAIQENADAFVLSLEGGGFDNVVGLPVARTLELLRRLGAPTGDVNP